MEKHISRKQKWSTEMNSARNLYKPNTMKMTLRPGDIVEKCGRGQYKKLNWIGWLCEGKVGIMNDAFYKIGYGVENHIYFWLNFQRDISISLALFISYIYMNIYLGCFINKLGLFRFFKILCREKDANKNIDNPNTLTHFMCMY